MKLNLTAKTVAYFLLVVMISAIGFGYIVYNLYALTTDIDLVHKDEMPRIAKANTLANNNMAQVANVRGFLLTGEEKYFDDYMRVSEANDKIEEELIKTARTEERKKMLQEIKALDDKYSDVVEKQVVPLKRAGKNNEALAINHDVAAPISRELDEKIKAYSAIVSKIADTALETATKDAHQTQTVSIVTAFIAMLAGVGIGVFSARSIARPVRALVAVATQVAGGNLRQSIEITRQDEIGQLQQALKNMVGDLKTLINKVQASAQHVAASSEELTAGAEQSAEATNQVAASISEVARGTESQVASVNEAVSVIEQMSAGIQQVAASTNVVTGVTEKTAGAAHHGGKSIETAIAQMAKIENTVASSAGVVTKLGERSKEIGQIVDTISGIAGQTNLLALNAAIEAARAGEQGRGFAEEVRKLAEQSQDAAKHIAELISEIQAETDKAVVAMNDGTREVKVGTDVVNTAGADFKDIAALVDQVAAQIREISAAIQQAASGSQQVVASIKSIDKISKENASETQSVSAATEEQSASMQEIASSSQSLATMAQELQEVISHFRI